MGFLMYVGFKQSFLIVPMRSRFRTFQTGLSRFYIILFWRISLFCVDYGTEIWQILLAWTPSAASAAGREPHLSSPSPAERAASSVVAFTSSIRRIIRARLMKLSRRHDTSLGAGYECRPRTA